MLPAGCQVVDGSRARGRGSELAELGASSLILSCLQKEMGGGQRVNEQEAELGLELRFWCFQQRLQELLDRPRALKSKRQGL